MGHGKIGTTEPESAAMRPAAQGFLRIPIYHMGLRAGGMGRGGFSAYGGN